MAVTHHVIASTSAGAVVYPSVQVHKANCAEAARLEQFTDDWQIVALAQSLASAKANAREACKGNDAYEISVMGCV